MSLTILPARLSSPLLPSSRAYSLFNFPELWVNQRSLSSGFAYDPKDEASLVKELVLQVRKVIGPFAAPKKIFIVPDLPKTRSGKIMRRIIRKISSGEGDQLGDLSTLADPSVVDAIKAKVAASS